MIPKTFLRNKKRNTCTDADGAKRPPGYKRSCAVPPIILLDICQPGIDKTRPLLGVHRDRLAPLLSPFHPRLDSHLDLYRPLASCFGLGALYFFLCPFRISAF